MISATRRHFGQGVSASVMLATLLPKGVLGAEAASETFQRDCSRLEHDLNARIGVTIIDTAVERTVDYRGNDLFPMCSVFKVLACAAVLQRVDVGQEDLNRRVYFSAAELLTYSPATKERAGEIGITVFELCQAAITLSDNTAANLILKTIGGPEEVTKFARSIGDSVTRLDRREIELNEAAPADPRDTTSPLAMAATLRLLALGTALSANSRELLVTWLVANTTGGSKLRAGLPKEWRIGDKTGSGGFGTSNDVAVIWPPQRKPVIVTMFITGTTAPAPQLTTAFTDVARSARTLFDF